MAASATLLWFGGFLAAGLWWFDGDVSALAHRLTVKSQDQTTKAGPVVAPPPTVVAEAESAEVARYRGRQSWRRRSYRHGRAAARCSAGAVQAVGDGWLLQSSRGREGR